MRQFKNIAVTGGAGFIGSNFIRYILDKVLFKGRVINIDKLTYAGNAENLSDVSSKYLDRYFFERIDICDFDKLQKCLIEYDVDCVVHFAAETHVDRSIYDPAEFMKTNILGTFNLVEACRRIWKGREDTLFHHVSTDEVFGTLGEEGLFYETTQYAPRSPYAASKASSDHIVNAHFHTYGLNATISNCSNNYGQYQFPEKMIPVMLTNMLDEKPLPVYGDGSHIRDWLYVIDHCSAIWNIVCNSRAGETYNIGGENEWTNNDLVNRLCELMAVRKGKDSRYYKKLITHVHDRPGHDKRYAVSCDKIKRELGWKQSVAFDEGLNITVDWYLKNQAWVNNIRSGEYMHPAGNNYCGRVQ